MNCKLCNREAKDRETFSSISWELVNKTEYENRLEDGRTTLLSYVCPECYEKHTGRPPLGLKDYNEIRKRKITKEQYYKEHGY